MSYQQAFEDHKYLFDIGPASDMTGGYVDSEDLGILLKSPTKKTAKGCLVRQIEYWFQAGVEDAAGYVGAGKSAKDLVEEFPEIEEIAERYFCDIT